MKQPGIILWRPIIGAINFFFQYLALVLRFEKQAGMQHPLAGLKP